MLGRFIWPGREGKLSVKPIFEVEAGVSIHPPVSPRPRRSQQLAFMPLMIFDDRLVSLFSTSRQRDLNHHPYAPFHQPNINVQLFPNHYCISLLAHSHFLVLGSNRTKSAFFFPFPFALLRFIFMLMLACALSPFSPVASPCSPPFMTKLERLFVASRSFFLLLSQVVISPLYPALVCRIQLNPSCLCELDPTLSRRICFQESFTTHEGLTDSASVFRFTLSLLPDSPYGFLGEFFGARLRSFGLCFSFSLPRR